MITRNREIITGETWKIQTVFGKTLSVGRRMFFMSIGGRDENISQKDREKKKAFSVLFQHNLKI